MHILNQKNTDHHQFDPIQHSKIDQGQYGGSSPSSPVIDTTQMENQHRYMLSPGSEGSQKNSEANPQDDM